MTRQAARSGFGRFVDDAITATAEQFSVARAVRQGTVGPGGEVVDGLLKDTDVLWERVVRPELDDYRDRILAQFDVVLDYVDGEDPIDAYRDDLLTVDAYADALREDLRPDRRRSVEDRLVERQRRFGDAIEPIVATPREEFWPAIETAYDYEGATDLVETHFTFTDPLREERRAFRMTTAFDPADVLGSFGSLFGGLPTVEIEYTDEALRSMRRAEREVIRDARRELDDRYA